MERKKFLKVCGCLAVGIPLAGLMQSCGGIYYATTEEEENKITLEKSQFIIDPDKPEKKRDFVLVESKHYNFPICLYLINDHEYVASLMKCTHRGCELNAGGGIYSCPCHGSEFSANGDVISGPASQKLKTFTTKTNADNVIIYLS